MTSKVLLAYCTFPSQQVAEEICRRLVLEGTIACANILAPMTSIYQWKGDMCKTEEFVAILKTTNLKREALKERIRATHPYDTPCLIFLAVEDGLPDYLKWVYTQS